VIPSDIIKDKGSGMVEIEVVEDDEDFLILLFFLFDD